LVDGSAKGNVLLGHWKSGLRHTLEQLSHEGDRHVRRFFARLHDRIVRVNRASEIGRCGALAEITTSAGTSGNGTEDLTP
jgi:hypothetical protein